MSGASHGAGTMQFMAIEVLERSRYTYRHFPESFSRPYLDVHSSDSYWASALQQRVWEKALQYNNTIEVNEAFVKGSCQLS